MRQFLFLFLSFFSGLFSFAQFELADSIAVCADGSPDTLFVQYSAEQQEAVDQVLAANFISPSIASGSFSTVIGMTFDFTYFGVVYNQLLISPFGYVSFDISKANTPSESVLDTLLAETSESDFNNAILAPLQNYAYLPTQGNGNISYAVLGSAPNRKFIVRWNSMPVSGCNTTYCTALTLEEGTGIIETHIVERTPCIFNTFGQGIHGLKNSTGSTTVVVQDPTTTISRDFNSLWGTSFERISFTPNGASGYTVAEETDFLSITENPTYVWQDNLGNTYPNAPFAVVNETVGIESISVSSDFCGTSIQEQTVVDFELATGTVNGIAGNIGTLCFPGDEATLSFDVSSGNTPQSILWSTGETTPSIVTSTPGVYNVDVVLENCNYTIGFILNENTTVLDLGIDTAFLCPGDEVLISPNVSDADSYLWSDGSTDSNRVFNTAGVFSLQISIGSCLYSSSVVVEILDSPEIELGPDVILCDEDNALIGSLDANLPADYLWNTGETTPFIVIDTAGEYVLTATANGCSVSDTILVNNDPLPTELLPEDTTICDGQDIVLSGPASATSFLWSTGETTQTITINAAGQYTLFVTSATCTSIDTIFVVSLPTPETNLPSTATVCNGETLLLSAQTQDPGAIYTWSTGETTPDISVDTAGTYSVSVLNPNGCESNDTVEVSSVSIDSLILTPDTAICFGDTIQLAIDNAASYDSVLWSTGSTTASISVGTTDLYIATGFLNGCSISDTTTVEVGLDMVSMLPDTISLCIGDVVTLTSTLDTSVQASWNTGETTPSIAVQDSGVYIVTLSSGNCTVSDTTIINVVDLLDITLGEDTILCTGDSLVLSVPTNADIYTWSTGDTTSSITVGQSGVYSLLLEEDGCIARDTIIIDVIPAPSLSLPDSIFACEGDPAIILDATDPNPLVTYLWSTLDTTPTISTDITGLYTVELSLGACSILDSVFVEITPLPIIDIDPTETLCTGDTSTLTVLENNATYLWSTGETTQSIEVTTPGTVWVDVTKDNCTASDTFVREFSPLPTFTLPASISLCQGETEILDATTLIPGATYLWSTGQTTPTITVATGGVYVATASVGNCIYRDTTIVAVNPIPNVNLGQDYTACQGDTEVLTVPQAGATYFWPSLGATTQSVNITTSGTYIVDVTLNGCSASDTIIVIFNPLPAPVVLPEDTVNVCIGETATLDATTFFPNASYIWNPGPNDPMITVSTAGSYIYTVQADGCIYTDTVLVSVIPNPNADFGASQTICEGESILLTVPENNADYQWSTGETTQSITVTETSSVSVSVSKEGCTSTHGPIDIIVNDVPTVNLEDTVFFCAGDSVIIDASYPDPLTEYEWNDGDTNAIRTISTSTTLFLTTRLGDCEDNTSVTVVELAYPEVSLPDTVEFCSGNTITLTLDTEPNWIYDWSEGSSTPEVSLSNGGAYSVTVSNKGLCDTTLNVFLREYAAPEPIYNSDTVTICQGDILDLETDISSMNFIYLWNLDSTQSQIQVETEGWYFVDVTNDLFNECSMRDSVYVNVLQEINLEDEVAPLIRICEDQIDAPIELNLSDLDEATVQWSTGSSDPLLSVTDSGEYRVIAENDCFSDTITVLVSIENCECPLSFPNAIMLNSSSEENTVFSPNAECAFTHYDLKVFSRSGHLVFSSTSPFNEFRPADLNFADHAQDAYIYVFEYAFGFDRISKREGTFVVLK